MCPRAAQLNHKGGEPDRTRHRSGALPFVGRKVELRSLRHATRVVAQTRQARVALITGTAGMGKTRLAEELAGRVRREGALVGIGRAWGHFGAPPLWPWQAVLRDLDAPAELLNRGLGKTAHERFHRFAAVADHLRRAAASAPLLVIVLDDVHLADEATLLLARFVLREQRDVPILFVLTRRESYEAATPEARELLTGIDGDATVIPLRGLPLPAMGRYLALLGLRTLAPDLLELVATLTEGNPHLLRQLAIRTALDGHVIGALERGTEDTLARLAPRQQRIVGTAALLGRETTVVEIAAIASASTADVIDAVTQARTLGIIDRTSSTEAVAFVHDLVRQSALMTLSREVRLDLHARAAALLRGTLPEQVVRRTHHSLEAAPRSLEDAELAIRRTRETAKALAAAGGLEASASLLERAFTLHGEFGLPIPASPLAIDYAEAVLACGRRTEARTLFERSAKLADAENDSLSLGRAALGLGGIWLREHRSSDDTARVTALQRRALAALPGDAHVLRARLQARLTAEEAYRSGRLDQVDTAIDAVRCTGDAHALAEALSLQHHVLTGPEHGARRLSIAEDLIASAAAAEDVLLTLIGLCWRAADLFLLGDARAHAALDELRTRAEALQCRSVLFVVRAMEVMLTIRAGRLDEAQAAAEACYALGVEVGDVDALAYYGGQLAAIRVFQGREAELTSLAASIANSPTLIPERERSFALAASLFSLRAGQPGAGRAQLDAILLESISALPHSSSWLTSMLAVVELAEALHDAPAARAACDALLPFAHLPAMGSLLAVVCFGSTHRLVGLAASTSGQHDLAIEHLQLAIAANDRIGHQPAGIQARAELGLAYIARGGSDDAVRGRDLVEGAIAAGEVSGMSGLAARWRDAIPSHNRASQVSGLASLTPSIQPGSWRATYRGHVAIVADRVGLRYLARLLATPEQWIPALDLVVDAHAAASAGAHQPLLDERAHQALRGRIADLRQRPMLSDEQQEELAALTQELGRAMGFGGRSRSFADVPERARTAVRKAIKRAIGDISTANPEIGQHLGSTVTTGRHCCYRPDAGGSVYRTKGA